MPVADLRRHAAGVLKRSVAVLIATTALVGAGCATHISAPPAKTTGEPHVSWIIMFGDQDDPNREFACQSDPRTECVVPPSRSDAPVVSDVHFYYHGTRGDTTYTGVNTIGFFQGTGGRVQPNITVKGDEEIVNQSITGIVTLTPGAYEMSIAVVAASGSTSRPVNERVRVVVR